MELRLRAAKIVRSLQRKSRDMSWKREACGVSDARLSVNAFCTVASLWAVLAAWFVA